MRRLLRTALPDHISRYLARKQGEVDGGGPAEHIWSRARSTQTMQGLVSELARIAGDHQRCMFCEDSRGVDIDHFWPKATYPERTFVWENLLLVCSGCNRRKGARFDLAGDGSPLLIDPTRDDPWDHLFYDSQTGIVTARFIPKTGEPDSRGQYTIERSHLPLNVQAVTGGRRRSQRNLIRCVARYLESTHSTKGGSGRDAELRACVRDNSDYGLPEWFVATYPAWSRLSA